MAVRLAATSDLHGSLPPVPPCDVLVIAGDITPATNHDVDFQVHWLDTEFRRWLEVLNERYAAVPVDTDVLLIHGPPAGYGDLTDFGSRAGSSAFTHLIDRVSPKLGIFGHIHEGRGTWTRGGTTLANVSAVDFHYELVGEPVVAFDI